MKHDFTHCTIIGKHPSAEQNLHRAKGITIGLNQAALNYHTDLAITGHDFILRMFMDCGFYPEKTILTDPLFERKFYPAKYLIKQGHFEDTIRKVYYSYKQVLYFTEMAYNDPGLKNKYPNWWTILHLALFFCVSKRPESITIIGCNATPANGLYVDMINHQYVRYHNDLLWKAINSLGINCLWYK